MDEINPKVKALYQAARAISADDSFLGHMREAAINAAMAMAYHEVGNLDMAREEARACEAAAWKAKVDIREGA